MLKYHDMNEYKPIILEDLINLTITEEEKLWDDFFVQYPHVFSPGPWVITPGDEIGDLFLNYQFLSIEYWNVYCFSKIRERSNTTRLTEVRNKLYELFENNSSKKKKSSIFPGLNKKIINEIEDMDDLHSADYALDQLIGEHSLRQLNHFTEYVFSSILYGFFEEILTDFIFHVSGNKCFRNRDKYPGPNSFNDEYKNYYKENKVIEGNSVSDYIIKIKYIDKRCKSNLFNDLIKKNKRFENFNRMRNSIMHANHITQGKQSKLTTIESFGIIKDTLTYLLESKEIQKQLSICIKQNTFSLGLGNDEIERGRMYEETY